MQIILRARSSGKTRLAIEWLRANPNGILITYAYGEEDRLRAMLCLEPEIAERITCWRTCTTQAMYAGHKPRIEKAFVDNADIILQSMFPYCVEACTATKEPTSPPLSAKALKTQFELDLAQLQAKCTHTSSTLCEQAWAPAHFSGNQVEICDVCEKELRVIPYAERKDPPFYERNSEGHQDHSSED